MKLLLISVLFLLVGIIMIPFTIYYSNTTVYSNHFHLSLSDLGGSTVSYKGSTGDKVIICGYSTSSIKIIVLNPPLGGIYLGQFNGNFTTSFDATPFKQIVIEGGNYPANVTASIETYNTNFSGIGYTIAGIFLVLGLILLWYSYALSLNKSKIHKSKL
ncbi:hypothetical protein [Acidianus brierleyi]|uniref:hypothetical protein n=1 Tax=Acidianus brierleyi TaxID=41673 RepID=UPI0013A53CB7|nr:hypothetical protein [Acidianus brierleyi]AWR93930.2 hypothetical protein DFR85_04155 [Acidianus brierleyi]